MNKKTEKATNISKQVLGLLGLTLMTQWRLVSGANPVPTFTPTNDTWNYDNNGTDWTAEACSSASAVQAPIAIVTDMLTTPVYAIPYVWFDYWWAFLPGFQSTTVPASYYGYNNYAWTIYLENDGDTGTYSATEPFISATNPQVSWIPTDLVFHYPAEHTVSVGGGEPYQYDLELQINANADPDAQVVICQLRKSTLSILFQVGNETTTNTTFLDFLTDAQDGNDIEFDLSLLMTRISGSLESFTGYYGTDNTPECADKRCYYIKWNPLYITEDQLNFFKSNPYATTNVRNTNLSTKTQIQLFGQGIFSSIEPTPVSSD